MNNDFKIYKPLAFVVLLLVFLMIIVRPDSAKSALPANTKMIVDYCEFALSNQNVAMNNWEAQNPSGVPEENVFKPWDPVAQAGVIVRVENTNKNIGQTPSYQIQWFTPEKDLYNEYYPNTGVKTRMPTINIETGDDKYLYSRCHYKVGNYTIFLADGYSVLYSYLTNDFNLTKDIIPFSQTSSSGHTIRDLIFYRYGGSGAGNRFLNNNVDLSEQNVIYPNTSPYSIFKVPNNLNSFPSSYMHYAGDHLREIGFNHLVTRAFARGLFYINNTRPGYETINFLKPIVLSNKTTITNLDNGESYTGSGSTGVRLIPGNTYKADVYYENRFSSALEVRANAYFYRENWCDHRGLGKAPGGILTMQNQAQQTSTLSIPPGGNVAVSSTYTIPNDPERALCAARFYARVSNLNDPTGSTTPVWPIIGSGEYPFMTFRTIDPRIDLVRTDEIFPDLGENTEPIPAFKVTIDLYAEAYNFNQDILPNYYDLEARIYRNNLLPGSLVWQKDYDLSEPQYADLFESGVMKKGTTKPFTFFVPILSDWSGESSTFFVRVFNKMKQEIGVHPQFKDRYISGFIENVYFKSGSSQSSFDLRYRIMKQAVSHTNKLLIFNPSESKEQTFFISVVNLTDPENITVRLETWELTLPPLGVGRINVTVTGRYASWPEEERNETFKIFVKSASGDIADSLSPHTVQILPWGRDDFYP